MLTPGETSQLNVLLSKLEPGYYPIEIFWQFCRLNKLTAVEVIPIVEGADGVPQILLTKRPPDDRFWPNLYHNPGCIVRTNDLPEDWEERIVDGELKGSKVKGEFHFSEFRFVTSERGNQINLHYWVELEKDVREGELFSYNNLPQNRTGVSQDIINVAVENYLKFKSGNPS